MFVATVNANSMSKVAQNRVALSGQIRTQIAKYASVDSSIHASFAAMAALIRSMVTRQSPMQSSSSVTPS